MNKFIKTSTFFLLYWSQVSFCKQPITVFCHGIIDNKSQINRYENFIEQPATSFDFPDAQQPEDWDFNTLIYQSISLFGKRVNRDKMFMATGQDIATLHQQIDPEQSYILYGLSRGGAAAINYLAQHNQNNIQALILEGTPADMIDAVNHFQHSIGYKISQERPTKELIYHMVFPAYQLESTPPVANIAKISNKHLPVLIVQSQDDVRVPVDAAYKLYLAFLDAGFTNIYLCILHQGKHAFYTQGTNKNLYLHALHSFYKKYGFAYNREFATLDDLTSFQPSSQEISKKLHLHQHQIESKYEDQKYFNQKITLFVAAGLIVFGLGWHLQTENLKSQVKNTIQQK